MQSLTNKMRALAIQNLKSRRQEIFERTRKLLDMKQTEQQHQEESVCSENIAEQLEELQKEEKMEEENPRPRGKGNRKKKHKNTHNDYKTKRYWRRLLQVSDWMVVVPPNLTEYYVGVRGEGNKCLLIMKYNSLEICDKGGSLIAEIYCSIKTYNGTILQIYFDKQSKRIIISDLILWKQNPMTASEFDFRYAWTVSNLNIKNLQQKTGYSFFFTQYYPCTLDNLAKVYYENVGYPKQGLKFVHKDSFYMHGHNPNVIVWKDSKISTFFEQQQLQNKLFSKAVGYINKQGQVRSLQNASLFALDRGNIGQTAKFVKFIYTDITLKETSEEDKVEVEFTDLQVTETTRNNYGPVDCLGKLFYKSRLKYGSITYQQLVSTLSPQMVIQ